MIQLPGLSLPNVAGHRQEAIDLAVEMERRGFQAITLNSFGDPLGMSVAVCRATNSIRVGAAIVPIYWRSPFDMAQAGAFLHEISGARFFLGIGVAHEPTHRTLGVTPGRPLSDMRAYVAALRGHEPQVGPLPPLILAALRSKMTALAGEVADGAVWADAAIPYMPELLTAVPASRREGFLVGNIIQTCVAEDREVAAMAARQALMVHATLPNYRNFWREAGYVEEVDALDAAAAAGDRKRMPHLISDRMLADLTLSGTAADIRNGLERFAAAGITMPLLVNVAPDGSRSLDFSALFKVFE